MSCRSPRAELCRLGALAIAGALALWGCGGDEPLPELKPLETNYVETGDLDAIQVRGQLRILLLDQPDEQDRSRENAPLMESELRLATDFAHSVGLAPVIVPVAAFADFIPALQRGDGDLIAANLAITAQRKQVIEFTVPLMFARQVVIKRSGDQIGDAKELGGRTIGVREATAFWATAQRLAGKYPDLTVVALAEELTEKQKLSMLSRGDIDLTIHDDAAFTAADDFHRKLAVAFPVTRDQPIAWGIRQDATALKEALDRFINQSQLMHTPRLRVKHDLPGIKKHGTLRMVTRNNAATYFLWRGELLGFEFEMAKAFAKAQDLRLEVLVAPDWDRMLPMLANGEADIAAAFLTPSDARRTLGVEFSRSYSTASEVVVARAREASIASLEDLRGRTFHVRKSSSYWQTLEAIQDQYGFALAAAPADQETEAIIAQVARGDYDLTLADSNILDIELTWRDDVKALFPIGEPIHHGWAVRAGSENLLKAVNTFHKKEHRSTFYNLTYAKYFTSESRIRRHKAERIDLNQDGTLSAYDDIIKRYADDYGFDWRLLMAQMYEESRFDTQAKSWAGARGLMQVLPRTAEHMGITGDLTNAEIGIQAGVKYLRWMRERFESELSVQDRMWFTLAGYNAGAGHVRDARRLAAEKGWNPDHWFDNVEHAMLLLSQKKYAAKATYGYVRGGEPVAYVRRIKARYEAYLRLDAVAQRSGPPLALTLNR